MIFNIIGTIGAIASVVSLFLYIRDKKQKKKNNR